MKLKGVSSQRAEDGFVHESAVDRTARRRQPKSSVFKLKVPPLVAGDDSAERKQAVYSVSTSARGERVTVITDWTPQQPTSLKVICCSSRCTSK